ncbi:MAG: excisionase family DNA-binding protein [Victivallales bacterium]
MAIDKEKWVSVNELADYLGFCKDTIYTWLAEKDMPALRAGKLWKFKISQVEQWLADGGASRKKSTPKAGAEK